MADARKGGAGICDGWHRQTQGLLEIVSDLVVMPRQPTDEDRQRAEDLDILLERYRAGNLIAADRQTLDHLINADYQAANLRADQMICAKEHSARSGRPEPKQSRK